MRLTGEEDQEDKINDMLIDALEAKLAILEDI